MIARTASLLVLLAAPLVAQRELPSIPAPGTMNYAFSVALDVDEPWLVVGAPMNSGRVHVYDAHSGDLVRTLPWTSNHFGRAVAVHGDRVLVGAPQDPSGAAYLFDVTTGNKLWTALSGANGYGTAVALDATRALVGAPLFLNDKGRVDVLDATSGATLLTLKASDGAPGASFGRTVAIDGNLALVGAPFSDGEKGAAYVFDLTTGAELAKLIGSAPMDRFGSGVAIEGGRLVVGSPESQGQSALYVFDATTFVELAQIRGGAPSSLTYGLFDVRDGRALVKATEGSTDSPVAYVFDLDTGKLLQRLLPCDVTNYPYFKSFAFSGAFGVGGSTYVGDIAGIGRVRRYTTDPPIGTVYCSPAVQHSGGKAAELHAWGSPVVAEGDVMLRADQVRMQEFGYLLASQTQGFVPQPGGSDGNLCLGGTIGRFVAQTQNAQGWGAICVRIDLAQMPEPLMPVLPGESWNFQVWFRDGTSSNFSDAVSIAFQ